MKKMIAGIAVSVGALILSLSGLCTLAFAGGGLLSFNSGGLSMVLLALMIGVPFILGGWAIFASGRAYLRKHERSDEDGGPI